MWALQWKNYTLHIEPNLLRWLQRERKRLNSLLRWCVREICDHRDGAFWEELDLFSLYDEVEILFYSYINPWLVFQQFPNCVNQLKGLLCFSWTLEFPWFIHCCFLRAILWPKLLCTYVFLVYCINKYLSSSSHRAGMKQASLVTTVGNSAAVRQLAKPATMFTF